MPLICDMGQTALRPLRRKGCWNFFALKNPTASAGFEPANLGTKGQHATSRPPKPIYIYMCVCVCVCVCVYTHIHTQTRTHRGMLERTILQQTNATTNSFLSIKSEYYSEHRCYNEQFFMLLLWKVRWLFSVRKGCLCFSWALGRLCFLIREGLFVDITEEDCLCFSNLHVQCIKVKQVNFISFLHVYFQFCIFPL